MKYLKLTLFLLLLLIFTSCSSNADKIEEKSFRHEFFFDTIITITIYEPNKNDILDEAVELCRYYDEKFNRKNKNSEVYKLNNADGEFVIVSPETKEIIEKSVEYSEKSGGIYDITICEVVDLWDFKSKNPVIPRESKIKEALKTVGYKNIVIEGDRVKLLNGAKVDFGSVAKGYIADRLAELLKGGGVEHAIINLGGNVLVFGGKNDKTLFSVGVKKPFGQTGEVIGYIKASDLSVVSSGAYERYFEKEGVVYHHIMDTVTGYPVKSGVYSVTVTSEYSVDGDILSTICFILGAEKGLAFINSLPNTECIYYLAGGAIKTSEGIEQIGDEFVIK